jgi:sulfate permease, SulP family
MFPVLPTLNSRKRSWAELVPGIRLLKQYQLSWLPSDLAAGVALGAVMVPVGLAFGQLAGLPMAGLYTAIFPLLAYALFGSSRQLVLSPDASMSALVALSVAPLAAGNATRFAQMAGAMAVLTGSICILGAILRLGFMADFLAKQVVAGYMHGLAVIIFVGQLPHALGIEVSADKVIPQVIEITRKFGRANWAVLAVTALCVAMILGFRRWLPHVPGQIVAIIASISAVKVLHLERWGVSVVGRIPSGVPHFQVPMIGAADLWALLPISCAGAVLAFSDTIVTGRAFASRNHYRTDANQEMLALGLSSIASGLTQGLPLSSSGARTAVAESAGGRSQIASVTAAVVVAVVLLFFTSVVSSMPNAALAGILIAAAYNLCDVGEIKRIWHFRGIGFVAAALTFLGLITLDIMKGIAIGVLFCLIMVIRAVSFPHDATLGWVDDVSEFHDVSRNNRAQPIPGVLLYRFSGPLFFVNCSRFRDRIEALVADAAKPVRLVVVDCSAVLFVDLAGCEILIELARKLGALQIKLALGDVHGALRSSLQRGGVIEVLGESGIYATLQSAVGPIVALASVCG